MFHHKTDELHCVKAFYDQTQMLVYPGTEDECSSCEILFFGGGGGRSWPGLKMLRTVFFHQFNDREEHF